VKYSNKNVNPFVWKRWKSYSHAQRLSCELPFIRFTVCGTLQWHILPILYAWAQISPNTSI